MAITAVAVALAVSVVWAIFGNQLAAAIGLIGSALDVFIAGISPG